MKENEPKSDIWAKNDDKFQIIAILNFVFLKFLQLPGLSRSIYNLLKSAETRFNAEQTVWSPKDGVQIVQSEENQIMNSGTATVFTEWWVLGKQEELTKHDLITRYR